MTAGTARPSRKRRSRRWRRPSPRPSGARHRRRATAGGPDLPGRDADGAKHLRDLPQLGRRLWRPDGPDLPEDRRPGRRYGELELSRTAGRHPPDGQPAAAWGWAARRRRHPAARLPGIPPGAMGRRGGLRGAAAESAAIRGQAGGAAGTPPAARADAYGEPASARPRCRKARWTSTPRAPPCRPTGWPAAVASGDVAAYFHTGGTTGAPKLAIPRTPTRSSPPGPRCGCKRRPRRCGHQRLSAVPRGRRPARLAGRAVGRRRHHHPHDAAAAREVLRNYWRLVERHRATSLQGVPTILAALAEVPLDGADISSLRYCRTGAAPLPAELAARFERQFGLHVNESLGMTEMAGISSISPPGSAFPVNCVGFPLPYVQVRIATLDAAPAAGARPAGRGRHGAVQGANGPRLRRSGGHRTSLHRGWLAHQRRHRPAGRTRPVASARPGQDRSSGAATTSIPRPSRTRASHPAVRLCAAVGAPDAYAGELPVAFVTLAEEARITEAELLAHAAATVDEGPARAASSCWNRCP